MQIGPVTLIDSSSWIEALRSDGQELVRHRVRKILLNGSAAWCDMIALELWNGARGENERKKLEELEREIILLPTTDEVWLLARNLAQACRKSGKTYPAADLVIVSCALFHHVDIESCDAHFDGILETAKS